MEQSIKIWCDKLLDTGKGNRLINFKDSEKANARILYPISTKVFELLLNEKALSFFDVEEHLSVNDEEKQEVAKLTDSEIVQKFSPFLNSETLLVFKRKEGVKRVLRQIKKNSDSYFEEKGINILHIAVGFLKWFDASNPSDKFNSPLILIPITLTRSEVGQRYEIRHSAEEVVTNPTLLYKLKNELNLTLPMLDDEGYEGESLASYFNRVNEFAIKNGWEVTTDCVLSPFSYLKINMFKDLKENEKLVLSNNNIKRLLNLPFEEEGEKVDIATYFNEGKEISLKNVVDADSSQLEAIIRAKNGESFVLQGPPGTGKSQTITNLIAEFMNAGKKVLFVSEKMSALNVVYNNLKKVGLDDYCLELHSNKANKKDVIAELYRVVNKNKLEVSDRAQKANETLSISKAALDRYAKSLHKKVERLGLSLFDLLQEIHLLNGSKLTTFENKNLNEITGEKINAIKTLLADYTSLNVVINGRENSAWYGFNREDISYYENSALIECCNKLAYHFEKLNAASESLKKYGITIDSLSTLNASEFLTALTELTVEYSFIFDKVKTKALLSSLKACYENKVLLSALNERLNAIFNSTILSLDIEKYYTSFTTSYKTFFRIFSSAYKEDIKYLRQFSKTGKLNYSQALTGLKLACDIIKVKSEIEKSESELNNICYFDSDNIGDELVKLKNYYGKLTLFDGVSNQNIAREELQQLKRCASEFNSLLKECDTSLIASLQENFNEEEVDFNNLKFSEFIEKLKALIKDGEGANEYARSNKLVRRLKEEDVYDFIDFAINKGVGIDEITQCYLYQLYIQLYYNELNKDSFMKEMVRVNHDKVLSAFIDSDKLKFNVSKAEIASKLSSKIPDVSMVAAGSQLSTLIREASKKRNQKPIRVLFEDINELIQTIKPCFLMSPLSVSTFLSEKSCTFDVVIFDEASQIFPWDAVGSIYRAKQLIVVGDSKQMPPTNFFLSGLSEDNLTSEELEENDTVDYESILDLCSACLPQVSLKWHYRSKTEELIAFSNNKFYNKELITFPSPNKNEAGMGVDFVYCSDGVFSRVSRSNEKEAEKVVDTLVKQIELFPERSYGIVAFGISQQEEIEKALTKRQESDERLNDYLMKERKEPLFIKNLETVQGDERDTIIFSIGYGYDENGKFLHNFGPLNKNGGERRLNVAVTRAKCNAIVVSSIKSSDIDLKRTSALGSALLKEYLFYAENGMDALIEDISLSQMSKLAVVQDINDFVQENGFDADINVGYSKQKIDIAVKNKNSNDYFMAIEIDGPRYLENRTTRDRERLRKEVLERYGWVYHRVWALDWFNNPKMEKELLLKKLTEREEVVKKESSDEKFVVEVERQDVSLENMFGSYEKYVAVGYRPVKEEIENLIKKEQPITYKLLLKNSLKILSRQKATNEAKNELASYLGKISGLTLVDDYFTMDRNEKIILRLPKSKEDVRKVSDICESELMHGVMCVVSKNIGISKRGVIKTLINLLGFTVITDDIEEKFNSVFARLERAGKIKAINDELFICEVELI